jgi:1-deoxy-D-xylulose-5-phosphate reductoisomerase
MKCIGKGGALPAVLNAANEVAVAAFLKEKISFCQIADSVCETVEELSRASQTHDLEGILSYDRQAREVIREKLAL